MYLERFYQEIIATIVLFIVVFVLRYSIAQLIRKYAALSEILEHRTNLVIKYISIFFMVILAIALFIIWSVNADNIFATITGVMTVIGVAFFAQWSVLSNITSGIILLFSFPFKIGDTIKIHDKDFPIEAEIEDIRAFYTLLRTRQGEVMSYPNNVMLQKGVSISKPRHPEREFVD
jgi:small-conductance mechanosensitive channel